MQQPKQFIVALSRYFGFFELAAVVGAVVGLVLKMLILDGADELLMISMPLLAVVYFLRSYVPVAVPSDGTKMNFVQSLSIVIIPKIMGIASAVGTMGILFALLHLHGAQEMMLIAALSLTGGAIFYVYFLITDYERTKGNVPLLIRAAIIGTIAWLMLLRINCTVFNVDQFG